MPTLTRLGSSVQAWSTSCLAKKTSSREGPLLRRSFLATDLEQRGLALLLRVPERTTTNSSRDVTGLLSVRIALLASLLPPGTTTTLPGGSSAAAETTDAGSGLLALAPARVTETTASAAARSVEGSARAPSSSALTSASPSLAPLAPSNDNYSPQRRGPPVPHRALLQMLMVFCQAPTRWQIKIL